MNMDDALKEAARKVRVSGRDDWWARTASRHADRAAKAADKREAGQ